MRVRRVLNLWPLAALCLLVGSRWIFTDSWPEAQSTVASEAVAAAFSTGVCLLLSRFRRVGAAGFGERWPWSAAVAGALLFAGMNSGVLAGKASPRGNDVLIALALVPAVIAVALVARGKAGAGLSGPDIAPGILAPAGLLLIFSQPAFRNAGEDVVMLVTPLCVGLGAVWLAGLGDEEFGVRKAGLASAGAAVVFGAVALGTQARSTAAAVGYDLAVMLLALLCLARLGARQFSAQFVGVPLLLLLEGLAIVRVKPDWQQLGGLVMMVAALVLLLRSRASNVQENTGLFS